MPRGATSRATCPRLLHHRCWSFLPSPAPKLRNPGELQGVAERETEKGGGERGRGSGAGGALLLPGARPPLAAAGGRRRLREEAAGPGWVAAAAALPGSMGGSASSLLDESKCTYIRGRARQRGDRAAGGQTPSRREAPGGPGWETAGPGWAPGRAGLDCGGTVSERLRADGFLNDNA